MSEFGDFVLIAVPSFLKSSIPFSIGLIVALFIYFGYFSTMHKIKADPYSKKAIGMFFLFFYLGGSLYVFYLFFFILKIVPTSWLAIRSDLWSTVVKVITIIYSALVMYFVFEKSRRCESEFTYAEVDPIFEYFFNLNEVKQNIREMRSDSNLILDPALLMPKNDKKMLKESKKLVEVALYMILFQWFRPFLLFVFAYIILLSNTSLITGLLVYSYIFVAFTFVAVDKGITPDSFCYAEIFLKDSKETEKGRIRRMNLDSFELLKKKKDGTIFLVEIPTTNVAKMELKTLEEVDCVNNSADK